MIIYTYQLFVFIFFFWLYIISSFTIYVHGITRKISSVFFLSMSSCRNRKRGPGAHRTLQHPRLCRLLVAGTVQRLRTAQVSVENIFQVAGRSRSRSHRHTVCSDITGVVPRQVSGVQLWGITADHPTNVCCN